MLSLKHALLCQSLNLPGFTILQQASFQTLRIGTPAIGSHAVRVRWNQLHTSALHSTNIPPISSILVGATSEKVRKRRQLAVLWPSLGTKTELK